MTQAAEDVSLSKAYPGFDLGLVARLARTRRNHPNPVMGRHHAVAAIDLRIVERGFVNCALEIVRNRQPRHPAEKTEHLHMRADPVRQRLREGRLRIRVARSAKYADE